MSRIASQLALQFECDEPSSYHDVTRRGFVAVLAQQPDGSKTQRCHRLDVMPTVLRLVDTTRDTWISQAEFFRPNRCAVNVSRMPLLFLDLDTYKVPALEKLAVESQVEVLLRACDDLQIPEPSLVVFSGRGLQSKWILETPLPARALPRWQAVENELCRRLQPLGADPRAKDVSRVLRLVRTVNSKSDQIVRVVHRATVATMGGTKLANGLVGYSFDAFADLVLPVQRFDLERLAMGRAIGRADWDAEKVARNARRAPRTAVSGGRPAAAGTNGNLRIFDPRRLAWDRLGDLRTLAKLRGWTDGAPAGQRDLPIFLAATFLAQAIDVSDLKREVHALSLEFAPTWTAAQVDSCAASVYERAQKAANGETVEFNGQRVDARYRWRNDTLIERLFITASDERKMKTIISAGEARRRDAERKARVREEARKAGKTESRAAWLARHQAKRTAARLLRAEGKSWQAVADALGYCSADAARVACKPN